MNLPNAITISRLFITIGVFVCLGLASRGAPAEASSGDVELLWWAFGLFLLAAVTDFVDGYLARRLDQVSMFGRVVDPFADKVLICGTLTYLLEFPVSAALLPAWFVVIVLARELLVTTIRGVAEASGMEFPAERLGKWKMVAQCATVAAAITVLAGTQRFEAVVVYGLWVTVVLTVLSGAGYVWRARALLWPS